MEFSLDSLEISIDETKESNGNINGSDDYHDHVSSGCESNDFANNEQLSSWEKWLLKKTIEDIQKRRNEQDQLLQVRRQQKEEKNKNKERSIKAKGCHKKWADQKIIEEKRKNKEMSRQQEKNNLEAKMKKVDREKKTKESFQKWYERKRTQQNEQKQLEAKNLEKKVNEQRQRQKVAEQAYNDWLLLRTRKKQLQEKWWKKESLCERQLWIGPLDDDESKTNCHYS